MIRRISILFSLALILASCSDDTGSAREPNNTVDPNNVNNVDIDMAANNTNNTNNVDPDMGPQSCNADGDCTAPEVCVFDEATGESFCGDPAGPGDVGDMCTTGADCASGLCINGACAAPCVGEADCPAGFECASVDVTLEDNSSTTISACIPEITTCAANGDCTGTDVCVVDASGDAVVLECGAPVGAGDIGDACTSDGDCESNLCVNDACAAPCERPNDCGSSGNFVCDSTTIDLGGGGTEDINVCQPRPGDTCLADSQCTNAGERCVATRTMTDVEFRCGAPNAGGGELGDSCANDGECAQNLCVDGSCAAPCAGTGDCASATDYTCDTIDVDLGNGNSDSASICVPPVVCDENGDCLVDEVCYIRGMASNRDLLCRSPNTGGGTLGQVCSNGRECANNLCLPTRFRDVCTVPCDDANDCNVAGYECATTDVDGQDLSVCAPSTPTSCTSDNDCPTQTSCAVIVNTAGDGLESVCVPVTGGDATGVACTDDSDCAGLVCLGGFCSSPCAMDDQCGQGQLCQSANITKDGQSGTFDVCETLPEETCVDSDSCSDGVRVCSTLTDVSGTTTAFCALPNNSAQGQLGDSCTTGSECRENLCLTVSDECSVVCNDDSDCAAGQGCTTYAVTTDVNFCTSVCSDNDDCSGGNICTINGDVITNDIDLVCENTVGAEDLGSPCADGSECETGLCLRTQYQGASCTLNPDSCPPGQECSCPLTDPNCAVADRECVERACTRVCDDTSDCSTSAFSGNALTACSSSTTVQRPNGGTKTISTCSRP